MTLRFLIPLALSLASLPGCKDKPDDEACAECSKAGLNAYRCAVGLTNNTICATDQASANGKCPEGAAAISCEGGSGGAAAPEPEGKPAKESVKDGAK